MKIVIVLTDVQYCWSLTNTVEISQGVIEERVIGVIEGVIDKGVIDEGAQNLK